MAVSDRIGVYFGDADDLGFGCAKSGVHSVPILKGTFDRFDCSVAVESTFDWVHDRFAVISHGKSEMRVAAYQ
jgi:hypothetical protein